MTFELPYLLERQARFICRFSDKFFKNKCANRG